MDPVLDITIGEREAIAAIEAIEDLVLEKLDESVDAILDFIEATQIRRYTQNDFPPKPPGSPYVRTFDLQKSSQKERTGPLSGAWRATIDYAPYVLGTVAEQALIHRDRWKSIEQVSQEAEKAAPGIIEEKIDEIRI